MRSTLHGASARSHTALRRRTAAAAGAALLAATLGWWQPATVLAATYIVDNPGDSGGGTLRQAILTTNSTTGVPDVIQFDPVHFGSPTTISLLTPLPDITDPVTILGPLSGGVPLVTLDGNAIPGTGLDHSGLSVTSGLADNTTITGLQIVRFPGAGIFVNGPDNVTIDSSYIGTDGSADLGNLLFGIAVLNSNTAHIVGNVVSGNGAAPTGGTGGAVGIFVDTNAPGAIITGNRVGTNPAGTAAIGNEYYGIELRGPSAQVGGTTPALRNIVSGNGRGIALAGPLSHDNLVQGNYIGTNATGTAALGTQNRGIEFNGTNAANTVGGTAAGAGNVISGNGSGIALGNGATQAIIEGNLIGVRPDGTTALPNTSFNILFNDTAGDSKVGGVAAGAGNVIANGGTGGVVVSTGTGISILGNSIHDNAGPGIDLGGNGITPNDAGDGDTGANTLINFPVITSTEPTTIHGTLDAGPGVYSIEIYSSPSCDTPGGNGEGATLVFTGSTASGTFAFDEPVYDGEILTATTTDISGNTSEFGPCFTVANGLPAPGTWVGASGVSLAGDPPVPTAGTFLAASSGVPGGSAQFTYTDPYTTNDGEQGQWSFYTTAGATGTITLPYRWTGLHAWFQVTAKLRAVVLRDGDTVVNPLDPPLVDAGPSDCCAPPSNGFDYSGTAQFDVQAGDLYGFVIDGSNLDFYDFLQGELTVGTQVPTDCANAATLYSGASDGIYAIHPVGGQRFRVYCNAMATPAPGTYLEVRSSPTQNFSSYAAGGESVGTTIVTSFTKLRLNPANRTVDIGDFTFSTTSGGPLTHSAVSDPHPVTHMPYATAMACNPGGTNGRANLDLQGTPFVISDTWVGAGTAPTGGAVILLGDQVVDLEGNGFCGWETTDPGGAFYVFETTPGTYALQLSYASAAVVTLSTPVVFASVSTSAATSDIYARVEGASNTPITVSLSKSASCTAGALNSPSLVSAAIATVTDAEGYFILPDVAVLPGDFVSIGVLTPTATAPSLCVRTTADNFYWPKALNLGAGTSVTTQDVLGTAGEARWYRFPITPGQQVTVTLSGLPADYDLSAYTDIAAAFQEQLVPSTTADLTRLSAEFAPQVFSPQVFSPQVFSPQVFSPDAYAPQVFSPQVFSPQVFSPQVFSPQVFSPQVFSPQVFSPQVFSPQVFSPQVFSPQVFSPQVFSPDEVARAFSSAQTRSVIGVSSSPATTTERLVVNTWNNTGFFYVRVAGKNGAFDPNNLFTVSVAKSATSCAGVTDTVLTPRADKPDTGVKTVILTDGSQLALGASTDPNSLATALNTFALRTDVKGVVVDVAGDPRVSQLKTQAAANAACPFATNLVAEEIKGIVDSYRKNNAGLRYVVIAGGDTVVPFFRYPDQSLLGQESGYYPPVKSDSISEASLRNDYVLSQDAFGAGVGVALRTNTFPVPGLAVGRLVETPTEIKNLLAAYTSANGVVQPQSSLVTGYDFLEDAANAVRTELGAGTAATPDTLITPNGKSPQDPASWTAANLRTQLLGSARHDLVFLAGHFSANSALAADFTTSIVTTELAASTTNFVNSIVFSAGCHAGYNLLDGEALTGASLPLDWVQAFSQKRAILVAGTGYQYGDTDFLEYSERLYRNFAQELRAGAIGTPVSLGEALRNAKISYLAATPDLKGIHEKAVLEATLFGLPMWGVDMHGTRTGNPGAGPGVTPVPVAAGPAAALGLASADLPLTTSLGARQTLSLKNPPFDATATSTTASWYQGPNGAIISNPAEPTLPLITTNVTSTVSGYVLRGVGFRSGTYVDTANITPLTGAATTEIRGVHTAFVSPIFYPVELASPNYFGVLGGHGGTNLLTTPVQYVSDPANAGKSIERKYTGVNFRLFYSSNVTSAALSDAPTIVSVESSPDGTGRRFTATVVGDPKAVVHQVWVTYTTGSGSWTSLDLQQCVSPLPAACAGTDDSRIWRGALATDPAGLKYIVQAANGLGLVTLDVNRGAFYGTGTALAPSATVTALVSPPTIGAFGATAPVTVELKVGPNPVVGKTVTAGIGGTTRTGVTGSNGKVIITVPLNSLPGPTQVTASFAGEGALAQSSAPATPFTITKASSALALAPSNVTTGTTTTVTAVATLTGGGAPLLQRTVAFTITGPSGTTFGLATTDYQGRATFKVSGPTGNYTVTAQFGLVVAVPGGGSVDLTDSSYGPATANATLWPFTGFLAPVDNPPVLNTASAGQSIPVKFGLGGNRGLAIFPAGSPSYRVETCSSSAPQDAIETYATANSGLTYDAASNTYTWTWKTDKSLAGKCVGLSLRLSDGSVNEADFKFK